MSNPTDIHQNQSVDSIDADRSDFIGENFNPVDYYPDQLKNTRKKRTRRIVLFSLLGVLLAVAIAGLIYWNRLTRRPSEVFQEAPSTPSPSAPPPVTTEVSAISGLKVLTSDPFESAASVSTIDLSGMDNIVNILLIGVDYAEERETWSGKDGLSAAHADVIIVLAVNFDKNTVNLISLPRDTYTMVPGVSGVYKLNGSLNCGGGLLAEDGAGFNKVCETASYLLGGIPINYYYAVTMPAVKQLVDAIGGVDYRLDVSFSMQGRNYFAGKQHMNGQAVLDYLRVRKEASGLDPEQTGDAHRVVRQKKMLVAIFEQLKKKNMLSKIPDILAAFEGQLFTNCSFEQTATLALYAYNMPSKNITMQSMVGSGGNLYMWNFSFIKQDKRIEMIRKIYGVTVPRIPEITESYARKVLQIKYADQYINTCAPMTAYVDQLFADDAASGAERYGTTHHNIYQKYLDALDACIAIRESGTASQINTSRSKLKRAALRCASTFDYPGTLTWTVPDLADMNEVYVDFR